MTEKKKKEHIDLSKATSVTPILIAARNGITEMVEKTLESYPVAMYDVDKDKKNIVLMTVEHKQPRVYELLLSLKEKNIIKDSVFGEVDCDGNSALRLAAQKANFDWPVPGAAAQMQWEIKWYEYIKKSMQRRFLLLRNYKGQTPEEVFTETHEDVVKKGGEWLTSTSNACSVVAGLFVTATFTMSSTVPDGVKQGNKHLASKIFAGSSFVSFCTSLIAVAMFLAILTSGYIKRDFRYALLVKLLVGLTAFYASIVSTLISFSTGHFVIFKDQLKSSASSWYIGVSLVLITFFALSQFPLYLHLLWATFKKVPQRNYRVIPPWFHLKD
ncbi:isoform 4 of serine/threonine-protein phosphatase 6 regulatory ankyrin repeat subunit a [Fagus crenata]